VKIGAKHSNCEVTEVDGAFIELQPAHDAMVRQVLCDASLGNAKVVSKKRLEVSIAATRRSGTRKVADCDAQRVAGLDVVIRGHVVVGEDENARAGGSVSGIVEFDGRAQEESAKLHFKKRETRCEARVAEAAFDTGRTRVGNLFDRKTRNGAAIDSAGRKNFSLRRLRKRLDMARRRALSYARFAGRLLGGRFTAIAPATTTAAPIFLVHH